MRGALKNFQDDVARINKVAGWLNREVLTTKNILHEVGAISGGCVVLLSGYFESFLKECMHDFIIAVNELKKPFHVLPAKMRYTHFDKGGKALQKEIKRDKKVNGTTKNAEKMADRLASDQLVWEVFVDTQANPGPDAIKDLIESVGIEKVWERLEAVTIAGKGNLKIFLGNFIVMRNECAHTGSIVSSPATSDLIGYGENLITISGAIVTLREEHLERIKVFEN